MESLSPSRIASRWLMGAKFKDYNLVQEILEDVEWDLNVLFRTLAREARKKEMILHSWNGRFDNETLSIKWTSNGIKVWAISVPVRLQYRKHDVGVSLGVTDRVYKKKYPTVTEERFHEEVSYPDEPVEVEEVKPGEYYVAFSEWPRGSEYDGKFGRKIRDLFRWLLESIPVEISREEEARRRSLR